MANGKSNDRSNPSWFGVHVGLEIPYDEVEFEIKTAESGGYTYLTATINGNAVTRDGYTVLGEVEVGIHSDHFNSAALRILNLAGTSDPNNEAVKPILWEMLCSGNFRLSGGSQRLTANEKGQAVLKLYVRANNGTTLKVTVKEGVETPPWKRKNEAPTEAVEEAEAI